MYRWCHTPGWKQGGYIWPMLSNIAWLLFTEVAIIEKFRTGMMFRLNGHTKNCCEFAIQYFSRLSSICEYTFISILYYLHKWLDVGMSTVSNSESDETESLHLHTAIWLDDFFPLQSAVCARIVVLLLPPVCCMSTSALTLYRKKKVIPLKLCWSHKCCFQFSSFRLSASNMLV